MTGRSAKKLRVESGKLKVIRTCRTKSCENERGKQEDREEGGRGLRMACLEEDADGREKGESCKA